MGTINIVWDKMGSEFTYNVWYARDPKGPWAKHNSTVLTDSVGTYIYDVDTNEYDVDSLLDSRNYYVKVTCNDRYNAWWIGYTGEESADGGYGHDEDAPLPPFQNTIGFKVTVA